MNNLPLVSEALMEAIWRRVATSSPEHGRQLQKACGKAQPEVTGFAIGFSSGLSPEVIGLVLYAHMVISEAFRHSGAQLRRVKPGRVMTTWTQVKEWVDSIRPHGRSALEQHADATSEPAVFRYIVGALLTEDDPEDEVHVDDEELWPALAILQTVSECLHSAKKDR